MTHAEACHAAFDRAGLWHWVGEGRRLAHFLRSGRWQPPKPPEPLPAGRLVAYSEEVTWGPGAVPMKAMGYRWEPDPEWPTYG